METETIYSCYPGRIVGKDVLYDWCEEHFGPSHNSYDHVNWGLTSWYSDRPAPLNPFKFETVRKDFYTLFALRWL